MGKGKVAIVGSGIVGQSWAAIFSRAGYDVVLYDIKESQLESGVIGFKKQVSTLQGAQLLWGQDPAVVEARVSTTTDLAAAMKDAVYVQECTPENPDLKKKVFKAIDDVLAQTGNISTIVASSSSNIGPTVFASECKHRGQCLVAHPVNPPFAIPVVELVPASFTNPAMVSAARALLKAAGMTPVVLQKEVDGFLVNRLQYALLAEAFRLVQDGVASPEDIDSTIAQGLALRWSFMGPFQTIDLNAPNGVQDYCDRYASSIYRVIKTQDNSVEWTKETVKKIHDAMREETPSALLKDRAAWRNRRLINLAIHKNIENLADHKRISSPPLDVESAPLCVPSLDTLKDALQQSLQTNFKTVSTRVVPCPDLTKWGLSQSGLGKKRHLADVGGVPFVNDPRYHDVYYDFNEVCAKADMPGAYVMGCGAGTRQYCGVNAELMPTLNTATGENNTRCATVGDKGEMVLDRYHSQKFALLANLLVSDGQPTDVIEVRVKVRTGDKNFVSTMREGLAAKMGKDIVGMAGVFTLVKGKVKGHVMQDFKTTKMVEGPEVMEWLNFYQIDPGMTCQSIFLTGDPSGGSMNLRLDHTHFYNDKLNQGGHYHYDTTPDEVEYLGYFAPAEKVYRISNAFKITGAL